MASYRLAQTLPVAMLLLYEHSLRALAQEHADQLPGREREIGRLRELAEGLADAHREWEARSLAQGAALFDRDAIFARGRDAYAYVRSLVGVERKTPGGAALRSLLARCPSPSELKIAQAYMAFEELAAGAEANAAIRAFAGAAGGPIAQLRAHRQDLLAALERAAVADRAQAEASVRREQARADIVAQLRRVEGYLRIIPSKTAKDGVETLRSLSLPRYSRSPRKKPVEPAD